MKIRFERYPIDVIVCLLLSSILVPIALLNVEGAARIILGLPFILFIPGYVLIFALFPTRKTDRGIDTIERVALSFGMSIATTLITLGLNYTPWGITLSSDLLSRFAFILIVGTIGIYRWYHTPAAERFIIDIDLSFPESENRLDKALTIILIITIIIALIALIYVIVTPKTGEQFTEFYLLGPTGKADDYPRNLTQGTPATIIIGVANHEYHPMNYTIETWLINQTTTTNQTTNHTNVTYHHMWFLDKMQTTLNHTPVDIEHQWTPQWRRNYTFTINHTGRFKLAFLLYTNATQDYNPNQNYATIAQEKLEQAYRECHLWINTT